MKSKRVVDLMVLQAIRGLPCLICLHPAPSHPHHVSSRGSGGDDTPENVVPLCYVHHRLIHEMGVLSFARKFRGFRVWLEIAGREDLLGRLNNS